MAKTEPSFALFERMADRYDTWYERNKVIAENEARLVEEFPARPPSVEVGAGTGYFASKLGVDVAVEPALSMLTRAWRRGVEAVQAVGENLPLRSGSFNTVYIIVTLCFLDSPEPVVEEAARILTRTGRLVSCIVPRDSSWGRYYTELGRMGHPLYSVARFYTVEEMNDLFAGVGLNPAKIMGTLSFKPWEPPRPEEPRPWRPGADLGFVCVEYRWS
ncbi:class I SAM-dependent methyltransferase [Hyperthermus butylicus]|uniref:SAM-dependent methyl transferase n=1 Tax=Hyperthermus butylicus (strain DSM 5456 / JCM 9403 / PLM1-5) TaxID=415426 RepID=A2BJQ7_HYPBU|nr:class I SAM-dependent methyltransferase [Hyperthermus butylicus]ABM80217.1 putative SAM-dependent methyl transferase [Hyperthermus butylicus DSM 5456]